MQQCLPSLCYVVTHVMATEEGDDDDPMRSVTYHYWYVYQRYRNDLVTVKVRVGMALLE